MTQYVRYPKIAVGGGGSGTVTQINAGTGITLSPSPITTTGSITANLSTGIAGGQSCIGGTGANETLTLLATTNATRGKVIFGTQSVYDHANDRFGISQTTPTSKLHLVTTAIGNSQSDAHGMQLINSTASTGGSTQQHSPPIVFGGTGWKSTAVAASQTINFRQYMFSVGSGTASALGRWRLESSVNGAAYGEKFGVDQSGAIYLTGSAGAITQICMSQGPNSQAIWASLGTYFPLTSSDASLITSGTYDAIINVGHTNIWTIYQGYKESSHSSATAGHWWNDDQQHSLAFTLSGSSTDNAIKVWPTGCFYSMYDQVVTTGSGEQDMMVQL